MDDGWDNNFQANYHNTNGASVLEKVTKPVLEKVSLHFDKADANQQGATLAANFYFISFIKKSLEV